MSPNVYLTVKGPFYFFYKKIMEEGRIYISLRDLSGPFPNLHNHLLREGKASKISYV